MHQPETPYVAVELAAVQRNITALQTHADALGLALWPHTKTHKLVEVARMQVAAGARGLTVAKLGEALVMVTAEPGRMLVAYPIVGAEKAAKLARLAGELSVSVSLDSVAVAEPLGAAATRAGTQLGALVELDVGMGRVGVSSVDQLVALAEQVDAIAGLRLEGIAAYPGHLRPPMDMAAELAVFEAQMREAVVAFDGKGLSRERVSAGATQTIPFDALTAETITELRTGSCVLGDRSEPAIVEPAVSVVATVVSTAVPGQVVIDAGLKSLSLAPAPDGAPNDYGRVVGDLDRRVVALFEEHGVVEWNEGSPPPIGSTLAIAPNHAAGVMNLHDRVLVTNDRAPAEWWTVAARGRSA